MLEYIDIDVTAGTQYCYLVTQVEGTFETQPSNEACATPSAPPVVAGPTDLTGSSSGFNVSLSWTPPVMEEGFVEGIGTPSSTRQGGDDISTATVITELTQLEGTNVGYFDDYDEDCGSGTSTSGDVVYSFTPTETMAVDLTLVIQTTIQKYLYTKMKQVTLQVPLLVVQHLLVVMIILARRDR